MKRWVLSAALLALLVAPSAPALAAPAVGLSPTAAADARRLLADVGWAKPLDGGYLFDRVAVDGQAVRLTLRATDPSGERRDVATLELAPRGDALADATTSASFTIRTALAAPPSPEVDRHLAAAIASIVRLDDGSFYAAHKPPPTAVRPAPVPSLAPPPDLTPAPSWWAGFVSQLDEGDTSLIGAVALLLGFLAWFAFVRPRRDPATVGFNFVRAHVLIASLQVTIFTYWALYWPAVRAHVPEIISTVGFAVGLDAVLSLWTRNRIVFTLAILPVVFSTHLFVWFSGNQFWLFYLIVTIGLFAKVFFHREGRHIFNPSALGITVVAALCYSMPEQFRFVDISHRLAAPPSMFELIFCLALVAQFRARIVLVSIGIITSTLAIKFVYFALLGGTFPLISMFWPPVFLAVVLLSTDPATIARTPIGRLLYGATYGLIITTIAAGLTLSGENDFFAKVIPIPFCNFLVPYFDAADARIRAGWTAWLVPQRNRLHIAAWAFIALLPWWTSGDKANAFQNPRQPETVRDHVVTVDGRATCDANPAFCKPFAIGSEIAAWQRPDRP